MAKRKPTPSYIREEIEEGYIPKKTTNKGVFKPSHIIKKSDLEESPFQLTEKQLLLQNVIDKNILTVIHGPAGSAKTISAAYAGLRLLSENKIEKIIITKPIVESSENLGFLPGSVSDKVLPYIESFFSNFEKIVDKTIIDQLRTQNLIEFRAIAYLRGATFDNALIILDEAQNLDIQGLMLVSTRLGKNSKLLIMGDVSQFDIKREDVRLLEYIKMISDLEEAAVFTFDNSDIMRSPFLIKLTEKYEQYKDMLYNGLEPKTKKQLLKS